MPLSLHLTRLLLMSSISEATFSKHRGSPRWSILIPIDPVPASRPRFARSGRVYYGKRYTAFRREAEAIFNLTEWPVEFPLNGPLVVSSKFIVPPPKKTKRYSPRGDVDNYFKTLDVLNEIVWWDDDQLVWACMSKEYGEQARIELEVMQVDGIPKARALSQMFVKG